MDDNFGSSGLNNA